MSDLVPFVLDSSVRRAVLVDLADGASKGQTVVERVSASESATYDALSQLEERGLVAKRDYLWELTGSGRFVADAIDRCDDVEAVIEADPEYWSTHDPTGLPARYRRSVDRLAGCEVLRAPDTDPYRTARRTEEAIRTADTVAIVAPVYDDRSAKALLESAADDRRLLMTPEMIERLVLDEPAGPDAELGDVEVRVACADVSMTLTDSELLFSLPRVDGGYDATTEVVAESASAIRWAQSLFEHYWTAATPVAEWVREELPEAARESVHAPPGLESSDDAESSSGPQPPDDAGSVAGPGEGDPAED